jgi:hypothetical protein
LHFAFYRMKKCGVVLTLSGSISPGYVFWDPILVGRRAGVRILQAEYFFLISVSITNILPFTELKNINYNFLFIYCCTKCCKLAKYQNLSDCVTDVKPAHNHIYNI